jgi:hypothetical protein
MNRLFKGTNVIVTYKTSNNIEKMLACRNRSETDQFSRSGICCLMCADCGQEYSGQTGRTFRKRYNEHLQSCKYQNSNSTFAKHLHVGPLKRITDNLQFIKKGKLMNFLEKFYICSALLRNKHLNEESTAEFSNTCSDVLQHYSDRCRVSPGTSAATVTPQLVLGKHRCITTTSYPYL